MNLLDAAKELLTCVLEKGFVTIKSVEDLRVAIKEAEKQGPAGRWDAIETLMILGNVELEQDDDGGYTISLEPAETIMPQSWSGATPEDVIDQVVAALAAAPKPEDES